MLRVVRNIFAVQRIYSGFKFIKAGIFFMDTSDYSSYKPCSQILHLEIYASHVLNGLLTNCNMTM